MSFSGTLHSGREFTLRSFSKLNLSLLVYAINKSGYHPICSVFQEVSLHDTLFIRVIDDKQCILKCDDPAFPCDHRNLLVKVFESLKAYMDFGFMITVKKQVPIGGGLGGGSSNAATFIRFLVRHCKLPYTPDQLIPFAKSFGADVPFFLDGGMQLVRGIGDRLRHIDPTEARYFVLILPSLKISTKMVFNAYDVFNLPPKASKTPKAIIQYQLGDNMLRETVFKLYPKLESICQQFEQLGCPTIRLSGTGSTLFFVVSSWQEAKNWELKLNKQVNNCTVIAVKPVPFRSQTIAL